MNEDYENLDKNPNLSKCNVCLRICLLQCNSFLKCMIQRKYLKNYIWQSDVKFLTLRTVWLQDHVPEVLNVHMNEIYKKINYN